MSIQTIRAALPAYAKDIKINLGNVLTEEGAPDLSLTQIYGVALASAYVVNNQELITAIVQEANELLSENIITAVKAAVTVMSMNNIYYRFTHLVNDPDYLNLPANLRMNIMGNPGVEKLDFELYSLAVSAINGCGMCIESHAKSLLKLNLSKLGIQSTIRIAAVINATAQALNLN